MKPAATLAGVRLHAPAFGPQRRRTRLIYGELVRAVVALGLRLGRDDADIVGAAAALDRLQGLIDARKAAELGAAG